MWQPIKNKTGIDKYAIKNGEYTICKIILSGVPFYELWHKANFIQRFETPSEAKEYFERISRAF